MIVYFNHQFIPKADVKIEPDDRGFLLADGVYEVIRSYRGKLFKADEHIARLNRSLRYLRIAVPENINFKKIGARLIEQNNLIGNYVRNGYQIQSYLNIWDHNYWDDWIGIRNPFLKFIPKVIIGTPFERFAKLTFPLGVDFHPMSAPYSI